MGFHQIDICLEYHRHSVVAYHAVGFVAGEFPHGEFAALLEVLHGGVDEVDGAFGLNLRQQGVQGAVGVPEGEDGVDLAARVDGVYLVVGAAIAAVDVAPKVGRRHAMVEGGVEAALLLVGTTFHAQLAEGGFPDAVSTLSGLIKVFIFSSVEVAYSALDVYTADGHLQLHLLGVWGQMKNSLCRIVAVMHNLERHTAADSIVQVLVGVPRITFAPSHNKTIAFHNLATEQHIAMAKV